MEPKACENGKDCRCASFETNRNLVSNRLLLFESVRLMRALKKLSGVAVYVFLVVLRKKPAVLMCTVMNGAFGPVSVFPKPGRLKGLLGVPGSPVLPPGYLVELCFASLPVISAIVRSLVSERVQGHPRTFLQVLGNSASRDTSVLAFCRPLQTATRPAHEAGVSVPRSSRPVAIREIHAVQKGNQEYDSPHI